MRYPPLHTQNEHWPHRHKCIAGIYIIWVHAETIIVTSTSCIEFLSPLVPKSVQKLGNLILFCVQLASDKLLRNDLANLRSVSLAPSNRSLDSTVASVTIFTTTRHMSLNPLNIGMQICQDHICKLLISPRQSHAKLIWTLTVSSQTLIPCFQIVTHSTKRIQNS